MKRSKEDWLDEKITEDLMAMADEREKLLMEMEELQDVDMPVEKLAEIHRELEDRSHRRPRRRIRLRAALAMAAVLVLLVGAGAVSSGKKLFIPEIFLRERGTEITSKINNEDAIASQYDEEEICQEIEDKLGVIPVRLIYRPQGMEITNFFLDEEAKEAIIEYEYEKYNLYIYISKDYKKTSISFQPDGEILDTITIESGEIEIPIYIIDDSQGGEYFSVEFKYFDTYYAINGLMEKEEFIKILENIVIKNI